MHALDLAVLGDERVALAARAAEHGGRVKGEIEGFGELARGIGGEVDLTLESTNSCRFHLSERRESELTPLLPSASRDLPHAFITNASLTLTTYTLPASLVLGDDTYRGTCESEQVGENAAGTPKRSMSVLDNQGEKVYKR